MVVGTLELYLHLHPPCSRYTLVTLLYTYCIEVQSFSFLNSFRGVWRCLRITRDPLDTSGFSRDTSPARRGRVTQWPLPLALQAVALGTGTAAWAMARIRRHRRAIVPVRRPHVARAAGGSVEVRLLDAPPCSLFRAAVCRDPSARATASPSPLPRQSSPASGELMLNRQPDQPVPIGSRSGALAAALQHSSKRELDLA